MADQAWNASLLLPGKHGTKLVASGDGFLVIRCSSHAVLKWPMEEAAASIASMDLTVSKLVWLTVHDLSPFVVSDLQLLSPLAGLKRISGPIADLTKYRISICLCKVLEGGGNMLDGGGADSRSSAR